MVRQLAKAGLAIAAGVVVGSACANPTGASVVSGSANFPTSPNIVITNRPATIINWQSFSIGTGEVTRFVQPNTSGAVLNRVQGTPPALLNGTLLPKHIDVIRIPAIPAAGIPIFVRDGVYLDTNIVASPLNATGVARGENGVVRFVILPAQVQN